MSPPPNFPLGYGLTGPNLHIASTAPVNIHSGFSEAPDASAPSNTTELTIVTATDEISSAEGSGGKHKFMK